MTILLKIWLVLFSVLATVALAESSGTWTQVGADIDGEAAWDKFGTSVSMSSDGTRVAIGATGNDGRCEFFSRELPGDGRTARLSDRKRRAPS